MIKEITSDREKAVIAGQILRALPEWFGIPQAREEYIAGSAGKPFFAAVEDGTPVGFLYLKETGSATAELAVIGVKKDCHRRGIGRALFAAAKDCAVAHGYEFLQVKTVQMGRYPQYDDTNRFYLAMGFREFEVFPTLWDEWNPCQIYVMDLEHTGRD